MLRFDMLRYDMQGAYYAGDTEHPVYAMKELGITYIKAVPQSIGNCWCFFVCDVPLDVELPSYIISTKTNPATWAGFGLSDEDAMGLADLLHYSYEIKEGCLVGGIKHRKIKEKEYLIKEQQAAEKGVPLYDPSKLKLIIGNIEFIGFTAKSIKIVKEEK